jgi:hypothetical protein
VGARRAIELKSQRVIESLGLWIADRGTSKREESNETKSKTLVGSDPDIMPAVLLDSLFERAV